MLQFPVENVRSLLPSMTVRLTQAAVKFQRGDTFFILLARVLRRAISRAEALTVNHPPLCI